MKSRQSTWLDFTNKANSKKEGHFAIKANQESIFKSPDTVTGRVGVVGSGRQMTQYEMTKQKLTALRDERTFKQIESGEFGSEAVGANKRVRHNE